MPDWCFPTVGGTQDVLFDRAVARALPTIVAGDGIYLVDDRGRRLLDACSGPFLAALGQGNERVLRAMLEQGQTLTYTYSRTTRHHANAALTERLASLAGAGFERAHLTSGGSEAVEVALNFLRAHAVATGQAQRHRVISLMPGYHGATLQTLGLNGDLHAPELWGPMAVLSDKIPAPLTFRASSPRRRLEQASPRSSRQSSGSVPSRCSRLSWNRSVAKPPASTSRTHRSQAEPARSATVTAFGSCSTSPSARCGPATSSRPTTPRTHCPTSPCSRRVWPPAMRRLARRSCPHSSSRNSPPSANPHVRRAVHSTAAPAHSPPATNVKMNSADDRQPSKLYTIEKPDPPPPPSLCPCHQFVESAANASSATTAANRPRSPRRPGGRSAGAARPGAEYGAASIDSASVGTNAY